MIKHTELRLNNRLQPKEEHNASYGNNDAFVTLIQEDRFTVCNHYPGKWFEPIPLSEEWLIRAGFGESHNGWYKSPIASAFDYIGEKTTGIWVVMDMESPEIKWVHQLQNLVFALTGEELTFKDL